MTPASSMSNAAASVKNNDIPPVDSANNEINSARITDGVTISDPHVLARLKTSMSHPICISWILPGVLVNNSTTTSAALGKVQKSADSNTSITGTVGQFLSTIANTLLPIPQPDPQKLDLKSNSVMSESNSINSTQTPVQTDDNNETVEVEENGLQSDLFPLVHDDHDTSASQEMLAIRPFVDLASVSQLISASNNQAPIALGNLGLCSAPGKKVRLGGGTATSMASGSGSSRAPVSRDLSLDFKRISEQGFSMIINLLDDHELAYLGAPWPNYQQAALRVGMEIIRHPIVEGEGPADMESFEREVIEPLIGRTKSGENVICHCRGGVGRAGLVACCWLMRLGICGTPEQSIALVRARRSPRAIETDRQEEFIRRYCDRYCRK